MILISGGKTAEYSFRGPAMDLIKKMGFRREEVVIKINGKLSSDLEEIIDSDEVEIIKVVFGG
ncbi:MoaD/ThiS family protein [Candidatus Micrarchaeota archaeon]|nr:MoaD/ThiS family protein [Candidatus Micrarchaeota archaeon]